MINLAFQETSYLAIRRSMLITSIVLAIVLLYQVDIPVPFTSLSEDDPGERVDHMLSAAIMSSYLIYLNLRWKTHSKNYLFDGVRTRREGSLLTKSLESGTSLIQAVKELGPSPLTPLLPTEIELDTHIELINQRLTSVSQSIDAVNQGRAAFETDLASLTKILDNDVPVKDYEVVHGELDNLAENALESAKISMVKSLKSYNDAMKSAIGEVSDYNQDFPDLVESLRNEIPANKMKDWVAKLKIHMNGLKSRRNDLLLSMRKDSIWWDVRFPLGVSLLMIFLTIVEFIYGVDAALTDIQSVILFCSL